MKYGNLKNFEDLNREIEGVFGGPLLESVQADEDAQKTEDVVVPELQNANGKYTPSTSTKGEVAAGNTPDKAPVKEAQLGCADMKKPVVVESFNDNQATDEAPMKTAQKFASPFEKAKSTLNDVFEKKYVPSKKPKYDLDATEPKNIVSDKPIRTIPKGWK
jgi:hypothetical protein